MYPGRAGAGGGHRREGQGADAQRAATVSVYFAVAMLLFCSDRCTVAKPFLLLCCCYRETEIRGFYTPVSATYKGARKQGRQVEGVQGWVDMSRRNPRTSEQDSEEPEGDGDEDNDKDRDLDLVDGEKGDESGPRGKNSGSGNNGGVGGGEHDDGNPSATKKPADSRPQGPRGTSDKNQDGRRPSSGGGRGGGGTGGSDSKGGNSGKGKNTGSSADDSKGGKGPKGKGPRDKGSGAGSKGNKSADDDDDLYDV